MHFLKTIDITWVPTSIPEYFQSSSNTQSTAVKDICFTISHKYLGFVFPFWYYYQATGLISSLLCFNKTSYIKHTLQKFIFIKYFSITSSFYYQKFFKSLMDDFASILQTIKIQNSFLSILNYLYRFIKCLRLYIKCIQYIDRR